MSAAVQALQDIEAVINEGRRERRPDADVLDRVSRITTQALVAHTMGVGRARKAEQTPAAGGDDPDAIALRRYRAVTHWIGADSWDGCSDCIERLRWATEADAGRDMSSDEIAVTMRDFRAVEPPAAIRATPAEKVEAPCLTCGGRREVGGFDRGDNAWRTEPCPECVGDVLPDVNDGQDYRDRGKTLMQRGPMEMLVTPEWLTRKVADAPDLPCEAGGSRIDHAMAQAKPWTNRDLKAVEWVSAEMARELGGTAEGWQSSASFAVEVARAVYVSAEQPGRAAATLPLAADCRGKAAALDEYFVGGGPAPATDAALWLRLAADQLEHLATKKMAMHRRAQAAESKVSRSWRMADSVRRAARRAADDTMRRIEKFARRP